MNDRIAQMAREAGAYLDIDYPDTVRHVSITPEQLVNFARLVVEDCAKVCDERYAECMEPEAMEMAQAIRARYSKE